MSKSRKRRKVKRSPVQFSPLTMLRPRLDALLSDAALADSAASDIGRMAGSRLRRSAMGRRVRLEDGKEIIVMGDPFDEDDW